MNFFLLFINHNMYVGKLHVHLKLTVNASETNGTLQIFMQLVWEFIFIEMLSKVTAGVPSARPLPAF